VGGTTSGRSRGELEDLIGLFVNPLALRTDLSGDPTFVDVVDRVRRTTLAGFDHQDAPFDKVVERTKPARDLSRNPLVQIAFEFWERAPTPGHLGGHVALTDVGGYTGAEYGAVDGLGTTARLDVELFLTQADDGSLDGSLVYAADLYDAGTMASFVHQYQRLLEAVAADGSVRVSERMLA
jgi:non-ribosomal peptide synthetase component F